MAGRGLVGAIMGIIVFVLVLLAMVSMVWYKAEVTETTEKYTVDYYNSKVKVHDETHESEFEYTDDSMKDSEARGVIGTSRIIIILGLIFAILFFIFGILTDMGRMSGMIPFAFGMLTGIFLIAGAFYLNGAMWDAVKDDFMGSAGTIEAGGGGMFGVTFIFSIVAFIGGGLMWGIEKKSGPPAVEPPMEIGPVGPPAEPPMTP